MKMEPYESFCCHIVSVYDYEAAQFTSKTVTRCTAQMIPIDTIPQPEASFSGEISEIKVYMYISSHGVLPY